VRPCPPALGAHGSAALRTPGEGGAGALQDALARVRQAVQRAEQSGPGRVCVALDSLSVRSRTCGRRAGSSLREHAWPSGAVLLRARRRWPQSRRPAAHGAPSFCSCWTCRPGTRWPRTLRPASAAAERLHASCAGEQGTRQRPPGACSDVRMLGRRACAWRRWYIVMWTAALHGRSWSSMRRM